MDADDKNMNWIFLQSANNLMVYNEIPQSYLIGIMQEDRNNELLEKEKLLHFLTEEVIPLLDEKYSIAKQVTIAGHSFGAYFATYAFLKNNALYNSCIAVSPAYWPNNGDVLDLLNQKSNSIRGNFYLAVGDKRWDEISLRKHVFTAQNTLKKQKNMVFSFADLKGFSHNGTPTIGFGLGLSCIYDEWEWQDILKEQEQRLKSFPDFWGHLEIKADALFHLSRIQEAKSVYQKARKSVPLDENLSKKEMNQAIKRLNGKIKNCH